MRTFLFLLLYLTFGHNALSQVNVKSRILFILDASNSMNSEWGKQTRIQAAKEILVQELEALRGVQNTEIALRVYGHQTPFNNLAQDCNDTKLEVPFGENTLDAIQARIKNLEAKGATPIARTLEASAGDFPDTLAKNYIILITDGLESCDNDPCVIAKKLKEKGVKVTPFVIGLGMDMSYLANFNCIGTYSDAEDKDSFRKVFNTILNSVLLKTTVQINLNDLNAKPTETNVTLFLYESGTNQLKYTLVHTLNRLGNPDTLYLDPSLTYDLVVNTLPVTVKKNIQLKKHTHNTIEVPAPQGFVKITSPKSSFSPQFNVRVSDKSGKTLNHQIYDQTCKYLVGKYDVEIFTIPRIYRSIEVSQSAIYSVDIEAPGQLEYSFAKPMVAQLFQQNKEGFWTCLYTFSDVLTKDKLLVQPGTYKMVYRPKDMKSSGYSNEKTLTIYANKTTTITLN